MLRLKAGICGICGGPGSVVRSRELLLWGLFRAEWALCRGGAALTLKSVTTGQGNGALLSTRHTALSLLSVHHLDKRGKYLDVKLKPETERSWVF